MIVSDRPSFDAELDSVNEWIGRAGQALLSFNDRRRGVFWRDNDEKRIAHKGQSPTSTLRSFVALIALLQAADEENTEQHHSVIDVPDAYDAARAVGERYFSRDLETMRRSGTNKINAFTDAQLLFSAALLAPLKQRMPDLRIDPDVTSKRLDAVENELMAALNDYRGVPMRYGESLRPHPEDEAPHRHDFITLYAVRGFDARETEIDPASIIKLQERLRDDVLRQLGYNVAGVTSRFDPSELAFTITMLNRFATPDTGPLTEAAVEVIVQSQSQSGAWPPARAVVYSRDDVLHIASFEVALALSYLLRGQAGRRSVPFRHKLLNSLCTMFGLIKTSYRITPEARGWCNDHARSEALVESWTTAIVLTFLTQYRALLLESRQAAILEKYQAENVALSATSSSPWLDMTALLRRPDAQKAARLDRISDPTDNRNLTGAVRGKIFDPIDADWLHRPPKKASSLILHGPPGTRKTSLVRILSQALEWPLVTITPPDFLKDGMDGFEAAAADLFEDLFRLRRVVVFFDECEDFFKGRPRDQKLESRTIGAFITAGMLPRLQKLSDLRWVLFVVATNSKLDELDDAVRRPGRFDFAFEMNNPTRQAAIRYLLQHLDGLQRKDIVGIREALAGIDVTKNAVSFTILDDLADELRTLKRVPSARGTRARLKALQGQIWPRSLV